MWKRIPSTVFVAFLGMTAIAGGVDVIDLNDGDTTPATIADIVYVTNSGAAAKTDTIAGDFAVAAGGKLYVGLKGTDAPGGYAFRSQDRPVRMERNRRARGVRGGQRKDYA